jgi:AAA domain/Domain of unknown function (DUF3854)
VMPTLHDPTIPLGIVEGEKKALKACQEAIACLGIGGLWNWLENGRLLRKFNDIALPDRQILLYPDSDVWQRQDLLQAVYRLGASLEAKGAHVRGVRIPAGPGKTKQGLDDYLVAYGPDELKGLRRYALSDPLFAAAREKAESEFPTSDASESSDPWGHIKDAPTFLSEPQPEFEGLAKELLAPGAITMLAAPRGLGKTQVAHSVGVALAMAGMFRGERVKASRVLLLDRDNPEHIIRQRLQAWGANVAQNLHILTRQYAPSLRHRDAWTTFPLDKYDVMILDAAGSFTEGITEREGRQTTEVLATIIDLARKGLAILLLQNATKDGLNFKGREE